MPVQAPNPLNTQLVAGWYFNENSTPYRDTIGKRDIVLVAGTEPGRVSGPVGGAIDMQPGHGILRTSGTILDPLPEGTTEFTIACLATLTSSPGALNIAAQIGSQLALATNATSNLQTNIDPGDGFQTPVTAATVPTATPVLLAMSWDGVTLNQYIGGTKETTPVAAAPGLPNGFAVQVGNNTDTPGAAEWNGAIHALWIYRRVLPDSEVALLQDLANNIALTTRLQTQNAVVRINRNFPGILCVNRGIDNISVVDKRPTNRANSPLFPSPKIKEVTYGELRAALGPNFLPITP